MTKLLVMGLGYVGLPLAQQAVAAGMDVTGCDISEKRVRMLNAGQSPIDDLTDDNIAVDGEKITRWQGDPVDLAILLQAHSAYGDLTEIVSQASILLDTTGRAARLPRVSVLL